ncbi:predicted protein [Lichtheimia corymbifera JMRC:FSU:9682]|uniref:Uncharacterized protein n=1 Tax=Lichtheimia corymbifera JMRC:FSU:9682 TaxID=1263082 RepID=A0A068SGP7_9FUNG|nr:predicted protein [Lichtheimia corymbifera JMRC:FSU:9682]
MVKSIKRKAEDSLKKSASKALRRVAGPTTSQIREAKQSIRSLAAAVEMLQETDDMKDERELVKRMRMMAIDNADDTRSSESTSSKKHNDGVFRVNVGATADVERVQISDTEESDPWELCNYLHSIFRR